MDYYESRLKTKILIKAIILGLLVMSMAVAVAVSRNEYIDSKPYVYTHANKASLDYYVQHNMYGALYFEYMMEFSDDQLEEFASYIDLTEAYKDYFIAKGYKKCAGNELANKQVKNLASNAKEYERQLYVNKVNCKYEINQPQFDAMVEEFEKLQ